MKIRPPPPKKGQFKKKQTTMYRKACSSCVSTSVLPHPKHVWQVHGTPKHFCDHLYFLFASMRKEDFSVSSYKLSHETN